MPDKLLTVYKASAGSGKTFTLSIEFITLLLLNPENYRHILAVTFTNKATEEMKMRILSQLYGISRGLKSSEGYKEEILKRTQLTEDEVVERCKTVLHELLHNYNYFRVETIDSFFQSVLKNLARELDMTPNLRVDIADGGVKDLAVDKLLENIDSDAQLKKQVLKFINDAINDDKSWNVIRRIKDFAANIFSDQYKDESENLTKSIANIGKYEERLRKIISDFETAMLNFADNYDNSNNKGNKYVDSYYKKLREKKFLSDKLLTQSVLKQYEFIEDVETYRLKHIEDYITALAILPNINQLALLEKIDKKVKELNHEGNRFLLGDTQHLLSKMIGDSDAPFIYEKIGSRLKHIMIDEFQDTSTIQWKNFKVLLNDCLDNGKQSLVVGDVKQSIYRWRSGDWNLLNNILTEFPNKAHEHPLKVNYRSFENIIQFNNIFFTLAKNVEKFGFDDNYKQIIDAAYDNDSIKQEIKNKNGKGYVRIKLLAKESGDYDTLQMKEIHNAICELKSKGVAENKIVILLRANDKIAQIAKYFASHHGDIKIISDEAFLLSSSAAVSIIINALKILSNHSVDEICLAQLVTQYLQNSKNTDFHEDMLLDKANLTAFLPQEFTERHQELASTPLYDLVEELVRIFQIDSISGQAQYLCTFFDYLLDFVNHNPSSLKLFLKEWETNISKKSIQSDEVDGVRIMSIHKSKGLEFENVIIPYCDWQKERSNSLLWLKTEGKGQFSALPLVPVNYTKSLAKSHFSKEYQNEHLQNIIDNLNLLYVAFTRPKRNLFIISKSATGDANIAGLITKTVEVLAEEIGSVTKKFEESKQPEILFEFGSFETGNTTQTLSDERDANVFCQQEQVLTTTIHSNLANLQFRESNKSNIFANSQATEDGEDISQTDNRERGLLLHALFSEIEYADEAENVLDRYDREGLFGNIVTLEEARQEIEKCFENSNMREWFSKDWKVLNEREILTNTIFGTKKYRCDRVVYNGEKTIVIDFKFGEPETKYNKQVMSYIRELKSIGFANVKGYLWYANEKRLEEVK